MEAENFDKAKSAVKKSNFKIDAEHKDKRTLSLEKITQLKKLFHFENRS